MVIINFSFRDFTSPHTLRVEFGLSNEMDQYDRNFKVRQIMGGKDIPLTTSNRRSSWIPGRKSSNAVL